MDRDATRRHFRASVCASPEGCLNMELTGTLLGSIIGYTLGSLVKDKHESN